MTAGRHNLSRRAVLGAGGGVGRRFRLCVGSVSWPVRQVGGKTPPGSANVTPTTSNARRIAAAFSV